MRLVSVRLLSTPHAHLSSPLGTERQLATSSFDLDADFRLAMDEATILALMPYAKHKGNLFLSYNINDPEFTMSVLSQHSYYYNFFGLLLCIYLFCFYFVKGVVLDPHGKDKGQLVPHVLLYKTAVLAVYPVYGELISYCAGFMAADLPYLNLYFG